MFFEMGLLRSKKGDVTTMEDFRKQNMTSNMNPSGGVTSENLSKYSIGIFAWFRRTGN